MTRIFIYDNREFPDPDPSLSVDQVKKLFSDFMPELATAEVKETKQGDDVIYTLEKRVGTKGEEYVPDKNIVAKIDEWRARAQSPQYHVYIHAVGENQWYIRTEYFG